MGSTGKASADESIRYQQKAAAMQCEGKLYEDQDPNRGPCPEQATYRGTFGQQLCRSHWLAHQRAILVQQLEAREASKVTRWDDRP